MLAVDGALPVLFCELGAGQSTIEGVAPVLGGLGLSGPILECVVDQAAESELGGHARSALIELAPPPAGWTMPPAWDWLGWSEIDVAVAPGLEPKMAARIAELSTETIAVTPASEKRAAWTQPGWYERARSWIDESLVAAGRSRPHSVAQTRHCAISAVLRCESDEGRTWFKASFPPFHSEASITERVAQLAPDATCGVIAADVGRGWLLLEDLDGAVEATDARTTERAIGALTRLQSDMSSHLDELRESGCKHRPLRGLAAALSASLRSEVAVSRMALTADRANDLCDAVERSAARVTGFGLPETLVHGDFHPGNVAATDEQTVLFDWSDGAIACPVVEYVTWAWWFEHDEVRKHELWSQFCMAWEREFGVDTSAMTQRDADVVAGAYHLVSYVTLLSGLDPVDQVEYIEGLDHFYAVLTGAVADTQSGARTHQGE